MSLRTLRAWAALDPDAERRRPGRPERALVERRQALLRVRGELERQGWTAGEGPVFRGLLGTVPLRLVRECLAELKAQRRREAAEQRRAERQSTLALARDVVWCLDATQLGRDADGHAVQAEVLRDVASGRTLAVQAGGVADALDVVGLLERAVEDRGGPPLVLQTDNGGAYIGDDVTRWLSERRVLHQRSLPRTPQHNPRAERGIGELKREAGLGLRPPSSLGTAGRRRLTGRLGLQGRLGSAGSAPRRKRGLVDLEAARVQLRAAWARLDHFRLRRTLNWKTSAEADAALPHWSARTSRERVWNLASCALAEPRLASCSARARRLAHRQAIWAALETCGLLKQHRGPSHDPLNEAAGIT